MNFLLYNYSINLNSAGGVYLDLGGIALGRGNRDLDVSHRPRKAGGGTDGRAGVRPGKIDGEVVPGGGASIRIISPEFGNGVALGDIYFLQTFPAVPGRRAEKRVQEIAALVEVGEIQKCFVIPRAPQLEIQSVRRLPARGVTPRWRKAASGGGFLRLYRLNSDIVGEIFNVHFTLKLIIIKKHDGRHHREDGEHHDKLHVGHAGVKIL